MEKEKILENQGFLCSVNVSGMEIVKWSLVGDLDKGWMNSTKVTRGPYSQDHQSAKCSAVYHEIGRSLGWLRWEGGVNKICIIAQFWIHSRFLFAIIPSTLAITTSPAYSQGAELAPMLTKHTKCSLYHLCHHNHCHLAFKIQSNPTKTTLFNSHNENHRIILIIAPLLCWLLSFPLGW